MNRNACDDKKRPPNPRETASIFSKLTFWWLRDLFRTGLKRQIVEEDIYEVLEDHRCDKVSELMMRLWNEELLRKSPSILRVYYRAYGLGIILWGLLFSLTETANRVAQPLFLGGLLSYFAPQQTEISKNEAYFYASGVVMCSIIPVLTFHPFILYIFESSMKLRIGSSSLIYNKSLCLSKSSTAADGLNGRIINLLSNDLGKYDIALAFLHDLWKGPMEVFLLGYFIYKEIGLSGILGIALILSLIPLQSFIGKKTATYRLQTAKRTDARVRFMNEIIQGIQVIKMYTWENSFAKMIEKVRRKEIDAVRGSAYLRAALLSLSTVSRVAIFFSLMSYSYFSQSFITARQVFIVTSYYSILNDSMVHFWPLAISCVAEGYVSTKRVREFLLIPERKTELVVVKGQQDEMLLKPKRIENLGTNDKGLRLKEATARWAVDDEESNKGIEKIDLEVNVGKLSVVIGQVGAGKTTLLQVILGELELDSGSIEINGTISYASQESWLFGGSIKNNILFVDDYDEERYLKIVKICALERDFELLPHGDETIVGERGISLSGGQKARVNLARAIYKKADIYLLDDPLSAVDTHVGKHIFDKCIREFLSDKVCVLITHQLQYLKDVQHIILMNSGQVEAQGTYKQIKKSGLNSILALSVEESPSEQKVDDKEFQNLTAPSSKLNFERQIEEKETQEEGSVTMKVYKTYFKSVESYFWIFFVFLMMVLAQISVSGVDFFVAEWVNWETENRPVNISESENVTLVSDPEIIEIRNRYTQVYTILIVLLIVFVMGRSFSFFHVCLRISRNLHDKMFRGITRATMYFFNTNPSGRILNRFSKDIGAIDTTLPNSLFDSLTFAMEITAIVIVVSIVNYWLLIPTFIMSILMYILLKVYIKSARTVKRLESLSRSPLFSHTNATLQGLSTIRAFKAQSILMSEFNGYMDVNTAAWHVFITVTRAFALWLDVVCVAYIAVVTMSFLVIGGDSMGGSVGLAITQVISLIGFCQWGMRQAAELENQMVSVERVVEYTQLKSEPPLETAPKNRPQKKWPELGAIKFINVELSYSEKSELVLKDLSFQVNSKEKIGIVGRTGAGKSSIIQALFRLAPFNGEIEIDNININTLGLKDLRNKISIIPQDPILFSGTLRSNLDPFEEKSDEELWSVLDQVELKEAVTAFAGGLECKMSDGGSNFSMGQRQLVCLARAILRNNNILILDEATANVDPETDKLIQNTIRTKFEHCTVLTIAHRLHTVMDSDRVLVMDAGRLVEFAHPHELLHGPKGHLRRLVEQTGVATTAQLMRVAEENYMKAKKLK